MAEHSYPLFAAPDPVAVPGLPAVLLRDSDIVDGHRYVWLGDDADYLVFLAPQVSAAELRDTALRVSGLDPADVPDTWAGEDTWARLLTGCEPHPPGTQTCRWCVHGTDSWVLDWHDGDQHAGAAGWLPVTVFATEEP